MAATIVLAGATGNLGGRIARELRRRGAHVRALVRSGTPRETMARLDDVSVTPVVVDFKRRADLVEACAGGACVVSALSGLRSVIVDAQKALLDAAIDAGVPRFIPSDYSIDFTNLPAGANRNFDLRREFHAYMQGRPIAPTSVFIGAFAELLLGQAPIVLFRWKRVVYWQDVDQPMDFTTMDDTASFTAATALDPSTPRSLHVAGDRRSARELAADASEVTQSRFRLLRAGSLNRLETLIKITRAVALGADDVFPPWQGMQYMRDMFSGRGLPTSLDNDRYPGMRWTSVRETLAKR